MNELIEELRVSDVEVIVVRRGENGPRSQDLQKLERHKGAEAGAIGLRKQYRNSVKTLVKFMVEPKKFRVEDKLLRDWLCATDKILPQDAISTPAESFRAAATRARCNLIVHESALERADDLDVSRWLFVLESSRLFERYVSGETLGAFRSWRDNYGIPFASSGSVQFTYRALVNDEKWCKTTTWHLKSGDKTSAERAARIYFTILIREEGPLVFVAYVGPHPADGSYPVDFGKIYC